MATNNKISLNDFTNGGASGSWAAEERRRYLLDQEKSKNALSQAQAIAEQVLADEGRQLTDGQIQRLALQIQNGNGQFDLQIPEAPEVPVIPATTTAQAEAAKDPGLWQDIKDVGSTVLGGLQGALAASSYGDSDRGFIVAGPSYMSGSGNNTRTFTAEEQAAGRADAVRERAAASANLAQGEELAKRYADSGPLTSRLVRGVVDAAGSLPTSAPSLIGGPMGAYAGGKASYDAEYMDAREAGLSPQQAGTYASVKGGIEAGVSAIPASKVLEKVPGLGGLLGDRAKKATANMVLDRIAPSLNVAAKIAKTVGGEAAGEAATGALQDGAALAFAVTADEQLGNYADRQLPKSAGEFWERREREAIAGGLMAGALAGPRDIAEGVRENRQELQDRVGTTLDLAADNYERRQNAPATPAAPAVPRRAQREEAAQRELFPEIAVGENSTVPEPAQPQPVAPTSESSDVDMVTNRRGVLRNIVENSRQEIADLEARQAEAPLLQEAGYDNFTDVDARRLQNARDRITAAENELTRLSGEGAVQGSLGLDSPAQPTPAPAKATQTRGGDTYYTPDGQTRSRLNEEATAEAQTLLKDQGTSDAKLINDELKRRTDKRTADRKQALTGLAETARTLPEDQRVGFISNGIRTWDNANPVPTRDQVTLQDAIANAPKPRQKGKKEPAPKWVPPSQRQAPAAAPAAPVATPAPAVQTGNTSTERNRTAADLAKTLGLNTEEAQQGADVVEREVTKAEAAAPEGFDRNKYKRDISKVVYDLAKKDSRGAVDTLNLIRQGKITLLPEGGQASTNSPGQTSAARFFPDTGEIQLNVGALRGNNTAVTAIARAYHEATHAGQFNDRQGRPSILKQMMGVEGYERGDAVIRRAAGNGNQVAKRAMARAQKAAGSNADLRNIELMPYFVEEVASRREGSSLGQLRGLASNIQAGAKRMIGRAIGREFDVSFNDMVAAANTVGREAVSTDVGSRPIDVAPMDSIMSIGARDFAQAAREGRVYLSQDGSHKFVLSDRNSSIKPSGLATLEREGMATLGDMLDHEDLFRNYPDAKNIEIYMNPDLPARTGGQYIPSDKAIHLNSQTAKDQHSRYPLRAVLLHETQHWIQDYDGTGIKDYVTATDYTPAEQQAVSRFRDVEVPFMQDQISDIKSNWATQYINALPTREAKVDARALLQNSKAPVGSVADFMEMVNREANLDPVQRARMDEWLEFSGPYWQAARDYNSAIDAAYARYTGQMAEAEAFFTQNNRDVSQNNLPINPEVDAEFGTSETETMRGPLDSIDPVSGEDINKRWMPPILTSLFSSSKGLGPKEREILEYAISSPAYARMRAEQAIGEYDYFLAKQAAEEGTTTAELNKRIRKAIDDLPEVAGHDENLKQFDAAMEPFGRAGEALRRMRDLTDDLTLNILQQRAASGVPLSSGETQLYQKMINNLGKYTHRQYAADSGNLGTKYSKTVWKDYENYKKNPDKYLDNDAVKENYEKVSDAVSYIVENNLVIPDDQTLANMKSDNLRALYSRWGKFGNNNSGLELDDMRTELAERRDIVNGRSEIMEKQGERAVRELLGLVRMSNDPIMSYWRGAKQDNSILQRRQDIPAAIRRVRGEITDPSMQLLTTVAAQAEFVARNKMMLELSQSGSGDLLAPGSAIPEGWATLNGETYGPLQGYVASPNMQLALGDVQQTLATFEQAAAMAAHNPKIFGNKILQGLGDAWGWMASRSKLMQVIASPMNFVYNFVGGPMTMITNGNVSPRHFGRGVKSAAELVAYAVNPRSATSEAMRLVSNDVVDSAFVGEIKNEQYRDLRKLIDEMAGRSSPTMDAVGKRLYQAKTGVKETYAMMDVLYKIANFYDQVDTMKAYYEAAGIERTPDQIDREAADRVKNTNFTYRRAAPLVKAIESKGFTAFGPYMYEVFRTQVGGVMQVVADYQRAKTAPTSEARNVMLQAAAKRAIGITGAWAATGLASSFLAGAAFGDDEERQKKLRAMLPEFLRDQDFASVGTDKNGYPVIANVSRFDPIGPATDIMRTILNGKVDAEEIGKKFVDLYVMPRTGSQIVSAARTMIDESYRPSRKSLVQQKAPEAYSEFLDMAKSIGVPPRVAKAWTNVGETLLPGMMSGWRDTNGRIQNPNDATSTALNSLTWAGLQLTTLDPAKPTSFAMMDYSDAVKNGRKDLSEFFADNPNRSREETLEQILRSRNEEKEKFKELRDIYQARIELGESPRQAKAALAEQKTLTGDQINAIAKDRFVTQVVSESSLKQYEQRELRGKSREEKREVTAKWKEIRKLLGSVQRDVKQADIDNKDEDDD